MPEPQPDDARDVDDPWALGSEASEHHTESDDLDDDVDEKGPPSERDPRPPPEIDDNDWWLFGDGAEPDVDDVGPGHDPPTTDADKIVIDVVDEDLHVHDVDVADVAPPIPPLIHSGLALSGLTDSDASMSMDVPGGTIKYVRKTMVMFAMCNQHDGLKCQISRACYRSPLLHRPWQGRPLAGVSLWLGTDARAMTPTEHAKLVLPGYVDRQRRRRELLDDGRFEQFFIKAELRVADENLSVEPPEW